MNQAQIDRVKALDKELSELKQLHERPLKADANGKYSPSHFEFVEHYGEDPKKVILDDRHTRRLMALVFEIEGELKKELEEM